MIAILGFNDEHVRIAELLINNGANVNVRNGALGVTPLDIAVDDKSNFF